LVDESITTKISYIFFYNCINNFINLNFYIIKKL